MKIEKFFILSWKKILLLVLIWFVAVILHNAVDVIFHIEEAFFFIIAIFVIPLYFMISLIYTVYKKLRGK